MALSCFLIVRSQVKVRIQARIHTIKSTSWFAVKWAIKLVAGGKDIITD